MQPRAPAATSSRPPPVRRLCLLRKQSGASLPLRSRELARTYPPTPVATKKPATRVLASRRKARVSRVWPGSLRGGRSSTPLGGCEFFPSKVEQSPETEAKRLERGGRIVVRSYRRLFTMHRVVLTRLQIIGRGNGRVITAAIRTSCRTFPRSSNRACSRSRGLETFADLA